MAQVSISEAIRLTKISRSHFYKKYINTGLISIINEHDKKLIDTSELLRVFGNIHIENNNLEQNQTTQDIQRTEDTNVIIQLLKEQLAKAEEDKKWLQQQLEKATNLLENKQVQEPPKRKKFLGIF